MGVRTPTIHWRNAAILRPLLSNTPSDTWIWRKAPLVAAARSSIRRRPGTLSHSRSVLSRYSPPTSRATMVRVLFLDPFLIPITSFLASRIIGPISSCLPSSHFAHRSTMCSTVSGTSFPQHGHVRSYLLATSSLLASQKAVRNPPIRNWEMSCTPRDNSAQVDHWYPVTGWSVYLKRMYRLPLTALLFLREDSSCAHTPFVSP